MMEYPQRVLLAAVTAYLLATPLLGRAHEGELDDHGCHDRPGGGYHCHRGEFVGWYFSNQEEMLKYIRGREAASATEKTTASPPNKSVVRQVQRKLKDKGYYRAGVDGVVGPRTRNALKAFQKDQGLAASAEFDAETLSRLGVEITR
jgi:hypothetical protein